MRRPLENWLITSSIICIFFGYALVNLSGVNYYLGACLILCGLLTAMHAGRFGAFNPLTLFLATSLPYIFASPIDIIFFSNTAGLDEKTIAAQTFFGSIFIICAYLFGKIKTAPSFRIKIKKRFATDPINIIIPGIAIINTLLVASLFSLNIGSLSRGEIYSQKPVAYDIFKLASQCTIIFLLWQSLFIHNKKTSDIKISFISIFSILITDIAIVGDRRMAIVMTMLILYFYSKKEKIPRIIWPPIILAGLLLLSYGAFRNLPPEAWMKIYNDMDFWIFLNPMNLEFGAFPKIWDDLYPAFKLKATYIETFQQIIPSALIPDRSLAPSVAYVKNFHPDIYLLGGGLAFNALIESIMNFGYFGPLIIGTLFGLAFSKHDSQEPVHIIINGILIYCLCFTLRNDATSTIRFIIIATGISASLIIAFTRIYKSNKNAISH